MITLFQPPKHLVLYPSLSLMVHLRINEKEPNPNPHINFITALPDPNTNEHARQLLRALAAQIKPVMKKHGFSVNSLEEVNDIKQTARSGTDLHLSMNGIASLLVEIGMPVKQWRSCFAGSMGASCLHRGF